MFTRRVNSYMAVLLITVMGSGAALLIMHVANANTFTILNSEDAQTAALGM